MSRLVRVQAHAYGPRLFVFGCRVHHFHCGIALIGLGVRWIWRDRQDLLRRSR